MAIVKYDSNFNNFNEKEPILIKIIIAGTVCFGKTFFMNRIQYYSKIENLIIKV